MAHNCEKYKFRAQYDNAPKFFFFGGGGGNVEDGILAGALGGKNT